ncbi:histidine kinase [Amycolatopsis sp. NPDC059657]|uniref:sensor histidine kinase n=1 Tax=Amycolatopsis sp. NPDC059657 TaxID=3346899 RepID=UPI00366D97A8
MAELLGAAGLWIASGLGWTVAFGSFVVTDGVLGLAFLGCGVLLATQRPRNPIGWLILAGGFAHATTAVAVSALAFGVGAQWPVPLLRSLDTVAHCSWPWALGVCIPLALLLFPDGELSGRAWRKVTVATAAYGVLFVAWSATDTGTYPVSAGSGYAAVPAFAPLLPLRGKIELVSIVLLLLPGLIAMVKRYQRGDEKLRRQMLWLILAVAGFVPWSLFGVAADAVQLLVVLQPIAITVAILRYQLLDIRLVISRALLYLVLSAAIICVHAGAVLLLGLLLHQEFGWGSAAVVTVGVAVVFNPARVWLQQIIDRWVYGIRDDPVRALNRFGTKLGTETDSLEGLLATIRDALRLPYAAFLLDGKEAATSGRAFTAMEVVPLTGSGDTELVLGVRPGQQQLDPEDARVLEVLAVPLGIAFRATMLSSQLQAARERLVSAREEERRRLRNDLHDGLGPTLAAVSLGLPIARKWITRDPNAAGELLDELGEELKGAIAEVRRVASNLRPSALDELDLIAAIREHTDMLSSRLDADEVRISFDAPSPLADLPAAVEVAAYRIVCEALANVMRHAHARHCQVRITRDDDLVLTVTDDGIGLPDRPCYGVGIDSMRQRATELGGDCTVKRLPGGGTRVHARLPLKIPADVA